jgi:peptide/nickel transport system permease protein
MNVNTDIDVADGVGRVAANNGALLTPPKSTFKRLTESRQIVLSVLILLALVTVAALAPIISPLSPTEQNLAMRLLPPGSVAPSGTIYFAGTDQYGRDVLSRLIYGVRVPLVVAILSAFLGSLIGLAMGLPAGFCGGWLDAMLGVVVDVQLSMPFILVALLVIVLFGATALNIILVFTFLSWPVAARVARSAALRLRSSQFVEAARVAGATSFWILRKHILPNALPPVLVVATVQVANFIIYESAFGFFGLGVPPPEPTWGNMLADARNYLRYAWWLALFPGLCIALVAFAMNTFGDGLRDVLDPREIDRDLS